jgi:Domain of unknown function (DUF6458)
MRLGTAIVLLALGAILTFALRADVSGIDLQVVGWILMIVGALGIVLEVAVWGPRSPPRHAHRGLRRPRPRPWRSGAADHDGRDLLTDFPTQEGPRPDGRGLSCVRVRTG